MSVFSANKFNTELSGPAASSEAVRQQLGASLFDRFTHFLEGHERLSDINCRYGNNQKLRILCYQITEYPSLVEAFNVAGDNQQGFLEKALFCSWLAFLLSAHLKLPVSATRDIFVAGLIQDIATIDDEHLVKLSPIFSSEAGSLNYQSKTISHPTIMSRYLETITKLPSDIKAIVSTHHERFDGTGFPEGKTEQHLTLHQQILIVINEVFEYVQRGSNVRGELSNGRDERLNRLEDIKSLLPVLKLNGCVYFKPVNNALITILSPCASSTNEDQSLQHIPNTAQLIASRHELNMRWPYVLKSTAELALLHENATIYSLKQISRRAWMLVTTAGILSGELINWLKQIDAFEANTDNPQENPQENERLLELSVLFGELNTMIIRYQTYLDILINDKTVQMSDAQRSLFTDLSYSMCEPVEEFDLNEFTLLNLCE